MQATPEEQQVNDLKAMFPSVDKSVINLILESNQMNNELAIDALLQLSASPKVPPKEEEGKAPAASPQAPVVQAPVEPVDTSRQIHDDELLAKALQHELRVSGNAPISENAVTKTVQQLESDEALALSLQNELFLQTEAERAPQAVQNGNGAKVKHAAAISDSDSETSEDIIQDISVGLDETFDKAAKGLEDFGKNVSNAWSNFTTVVGSKLTETFNPEGAPTSPQLIVRTAPRATARDDEEKKPFL
jgi:hypothetical protein